jgi:hypothetical protein
MGFSNPGTAPTISRSRSYCLEGISKSSISAAKRISGGGEPDPEGVRSRAGYCFPKEKRKHWPRSHRLGRKAPEDVAATAKPDTILGWHRKLLTNKFDGSKFRRSVGRQNQASCRDVRQGQDDPFCRVLRLLTGALTRALRGSHADQRLFGQERQFDKAIAAFSFPYTDQNGKDHAALKLAIRDGKVKAVVARR